MFLKAIVLCSLVIIFCSRCDGYFAVVGSRFVLYKGVYELYITRNDEMESDYLLKFILEGLISEDKRRNSLSLQRNHNNHEYQISFDLSKHDTVENFTLTVELDDSEIIQTVDIYMVVEKPTTLIQTDKPVYNPGDDVKYRVLVLDAKSKPYQSKNIEVTISDSNKNVISDSLIEDDDELWVDWVHQGHYSISDSPPLGRWNVNVKVNDSHVTTKSFEVAEHVLPRFNAHIDCKSHWLLADGQLAMHIFAEYSFEGSLKGSVKGNAAITVEGLSRSNVSYVVLQRVEAKVSSKRRIDFSFVDDLKLTSPSRLRINVTIEEENTGEKASSSRIIQIHERDIHQIALTKVERNFKPGFIFKTRATVRKFDGELEMNESDRVEFFVNIINYAARTEQVILKNGVAELSVKIPKGAERINVTATYKEATTFKVIDQKRSKGYLKASLISESNRVGEIVKVQVESSLSLDKVYILTTGLLNMTHRTVSNGRKVDKFEFEVEATLDMVPTLNVLVYYIHDYSDVVYDRLTIDVENTIRNQLDVKLSSKLLSPGDSLTVTMKTTPNAIIALSAVDFSVSNGKADDNNIDKTSVLAEKLKFEQSLSFEELKINGKKSKFQEFGESNAFIVTNANGDFERITSRFDDVNYDDWLDDILEDASATPSVRLRQNFQETWIFKCYKADQNGSVNITNIAVPDSITSWIFSGFSFHSKFGLTVLEPQRLFVKQNFFIKLNLPYSIRQGEILKVVVSIFNYIVDRRINTSVKVVMANSPSFEIIEKTTKCSFQAMIGEEKSKFVSVASNAVGSTFFYIRSLDYTGKIKLRIKAMAQGIDVSDEIEKELLVEHDGTTYHRNKPIWIDLSKGSFNIKPFTLQPPQDAIEKSVKFGSSLIGDLLGPAVLDVSKLIRLPTGCAEQRLVSFVPTIVATRYLMSINKLTRDRKEMANKVLRTGYNQILERKNIDGGYNLWGLGKSDSIWLTAYVVKCLIQAKGLLFFNDKHIYDGLNYLKSKQDSSGSFSEHGPISHRRIQGGITNGVTLTAYILISFLENPVYAEDYKDTINKSLEFIKSKVIGLNNNYVYAITAYAMALANHSAAAQILGELNSTAHFLEDQMYWQKSIDASDEESNSAHEVELAAYALLAFLKHGDTLTAISIMKWLMAKRNANGGFYSTQDTVVGIQAISEMAKLFYDPNVNMNIRVTFGDSLKLINVNATNSLSLQNFEIPATARYFDVRAEGTGKALLNIWYSYNIKAMTHLKAFNLSLKAQASKNKDVFYLRTSVSYVPSPLRESNYSGMALIEIQLPSGYSYDSESIQFLNSWNVKKVETRDRKSMVILYFDRITTDQICPEVKAIRVQEVEQIRSSSVKVYEYSNGETRAIDYYTPSKAQSCF